MNGEQFYKSLDLVNGNLQLSTTEGGVKRVSQTLREILESGIIFPNTNHHTLPKRLCTSFACGHYSIYSYRPNGIYFTTSNSPDFCCPVDIMNLTMDPENTSCTNNSDLIPGHEIFFFRSLDEMIHSAYCPAIAEKKVNRFREDHGQKAINASQYNECCFYSPITIRPISLYGPDTKEIAAEFHLDHFPNVIPLGEKVLYSLVYCNILGMGRFAPKSGKTTGIELIEKMKKIMQRLVVTGTLALAGLGLFKLGTHNGYETGFLGGMVKSYNCIDDRARIITERLLTNPLINQEILDIPGKKVVSSTDEQMHSSYDYPGIYLGLLNQAEQIQDARTRTSLVNSADQLRGCYSALEDIMEKRYEMERSKKVKESQPFPINWQFVR